MGHIVVHVAGPAIDEVDLKAVCLPAHLSQHQGQQAGLMFKSCKGLHPTDFEFFEFMTQQDAFLRPFFPFLM